jgi:hypothetical protein
MSFNNKFTSFAGAEEEEMNLPIAPANQPKKVSNPKAKIVIKAKAADNDTAGYAAVGQTREARGRGGRGGRGNRNFENN